MQIEWFVFFKNSILGPYSTNDVHAQLADGKITNESFVWWKGEKDWVPVDAWLKYYPEIIKKLEQHFSMKWKVKNGKNITPVMTFDECLNYLKQIELNNTIYICKESDQEAQWETIFSNTIFLNALEMNRRKHPRVPILATSKISKLDSKFSYLVKVNTIGQGGMGISGLGKNFPTGTAIQVKIESPSLTNPISSEGKILYHTRDGISGIEFTQMNAESKALLISYVKQFHTAQNEDEQQAA